MRDPQGRRVENEPTSIGGVVELRPGARDPHEFPEALFAESPDGYVAAGLPTEGTVMDVDLLPGQGEQLVSEKARQVSQWQRSRLGVDCSTAWRQLRSMGIGWRAMDLKKGWDSRITLGTRLSRSSR